MKTKERYRQLENGVNYNIVPVNFCDGVLISLWIKRGSRDDIYFRPGTAHFTEHLLIKGNDKYSSTDRIVNTIGSFGGDIELATNREYIRVLIKTQAVGLDKCIDLLYSIVNKPLFCHCDIDSEKKIISYEIRDNINDIPSEYDRLLYENLFDYDSGMRYMITGAKEDIQKINQSDLIDYWNHINNNDILVQVIGNVEKEAVINSFTKTFSKLNRHSIVKEIIKIEQYDLMLPKQKMDDDFFIMGYRFDDLSFLEEVVIELLHVIFCTNYNSKLTKALRIDNEFVYSEYYSFDLYTNCIVWSFGGYVDEKNIDSAIKLVKEELDKIYSISEEEFISAKNNMIMRTTIFDLHRLDKVYGKNFALKRDIHDLELKKELTKRIDIITFKTLVAKLIDCSHSSVVKATIGSIND